tara:strand:- start:375 stop:1094 length:720 start_codon:yes stop_codon:yes gene_type:complete
MPKSPPPPPNPTKGRTFNRTDNYLAQQKLQAIVREHGWSVSTAMIAAEELQVSTRTIQRMWWRGVRWAVEGVNDGTTDDLRARQILRLEETIAAAVREKQYSAAVKGEQVYAMLVGTYAPVQVHHTGAVSVNHSAAIAQVSRLTPEELRALATGEPRQIIDVEATVEAAPVLEEPLVEAAPPAEAPQAVEGAPRRPHSAVERALERLKQSRRPDGAPGSGSALVELVGEGADEAPKDLG